MKHCLICNAMIRRWHNSRFGDCPEVTDYRKDYCLTCRIVFGLKIPV